MVLLNTILTTAFRLMALATLGLIINVVIHLEVHSDSYPRSPSSVSTPSPPQERDVSLNDTAVNPTEKRPTMEDFIYIQCPSDGDFGDEAWKGLACKRRLPSVLGIGFQRCGTTALNLFLSTHPVIKHTIPYQVAFWNSNKNRGVEWYLDQMPVSSKYQETMETTSTYIFNENVPKMISYVKPDMKFIVMVCDPIDRAMSDFVHLTGIGYQDYVEERPHENANGPHPYLAETFDRSVLDTHQDYPLTNNSLLVHGQYILYIRKWLEYFPMGNFLILDGTSFKTHPLPILRQVEDFLEIPNYFDKNKLYYEPYKGFFCRSKPSRVCTTKNVGRHHPSIDDDVSNKLKTFYRKHNKELEMLIGKNLTWV